MSVEHLPVGDEDLMMLIRNDDTRAFEAFFDRHSPVAFNLAMRILNDRGLAADVTQEAFLKFWRARATYRASRGVGRTWLLAIVRNGAIDVWRHEHRRTDVDGEKLSARDDTSVCIEDQVIARDEHLHVRRLLDALPDEQRHVIELAYFGGFSHSQIAKHLGLPPGTAKSRMRLALKKLRIALNDSQTARPISEAQHSAIAADTIASTLIG
jgi:RNA polymerase sigma-70 factor, ECF subfamily